MHQFSITGLWVGIPSVVPGHIGSTTEWPPIPSGQCATAPAFRTQSTADRTRAVGFQPRRCDRRTIGGSGTAFTWDRCVAASRQHFLLEKPRLSGRCDGSLCRRRPRRTPPEARQLRDRDQTFETVSTWQLDLQGRSTGQPLPGSLVAHRMYTQKRIDRSSSRD